MKHCDYYCSTIGSFDNTKLLIDKQDHMSNKSLFLLAKERF